ncbi:MAG: hypothetical protein RIE53_02910 [Rhodothermales bacterium]
MLWLWPVSVSAQRESTSELLSIYVRNRTLALARLEAMRTDGRVGLFPVMPVPSASDSLLRYLESLKEPLPEPDVTPATIEITHWKWVERLRRPTYEDAFRATPWAFVGSNSRDGLDTLQTREIRARMETVFGPPTFTLAETDAFDELTNDEIIQFEYWFMLNDSIPVMVMDPNGPWDRGLVVAAHEDYREQLRDLKDAFLWQLLGDADRTPFADYYFNVQQRTWYITGYDGALFFDRRIARPDLELGRPSIIPFLRDEN